MVVSGTIVSHSRHAAPKRAWFAVGIAERSEGLEPSTPHTLKSGPQVRPGPRKPGIHGVAVDPGPT
jgi:hypothetical protein